MLTTARSAKRGEARTEGAPESAIRARVVKCMLNERMTMLVERLSVLVNESEDEG